MWIYFEWHVVPSNGSREYWLNICRGIWQWIVPCVCLDNSFFLHFQLLTKHRIDLIHVDGKTVPWRRRNQLTRLFRLSIHRHPHVRRRMEDERTAAHGVDDVDEWHLFSIQAFCVVCATYAHATRHGFVRNSITIERFAISFIELICQKFVFSFDPGSIRLFDIDIHSVVLCRAVPCRVVPINLLTDAEWLVCPLMWHTKSIARKKFAILMSKGEILQIQGPNGGKSYFGTFG